MNAPVADLVGQHFMIDFSGHEITPALTRFLREGRIGGVILFAKNFRSIQQLRVLTNDLQDLATGAGLPPLLISIDQEGGLVNRLTEGCTVFPGAMALGATGRTEDAETAGRITALELHALGINTNHAPVLDVNTNPANPVIGVRAFGDDPTQVARLGIAYLRATQSAGVLATVKHFPGHGDTAVDSHLDLPQVTKDIAALRGEEFHPFAEAIAAGADGLMAAHIVYHALDTAHPATLSPAVMTRLLREELGFRGVALTDSMEMKAVADRWSRGEAAVAALRAGNDIVMECGSLEAQWAAIEEVRQALQSGALDPAELRTSSARIAQIKARYAAADRTNGADRDDAEVGSDVHRQAAQAIADRAVTLVRNNAERIPLPAGRTAVIHVGHTTGLDPDLAHLIPDVVLVRNADDVRRSTWDTVVAVSPSRRSDASADTIRALHRHFGARLVVVGLGSPYELLQFPDVDTYLATYGPDRPSVRAAAKVLSGRLTPTGRLPVTLPGLHPRGHAA